MPISFYHGFEAAEPAALSNYPKTISKLLAYLDALEQQDNQRDGSQHVALRLETKLVRGKDASCVAFRWTDDPNAPAVTWIMHTTSLRSIWLARLMSLVFE